MSKKIEFKLPEDYSVPENVSTNGQFDALATIQLKEDGKACLVAIDGHRMPGYTENEPAEPEDDKRSYAQAASDSSGLTAY